MAEQGEEFDSDAWRLISVLFSSMPLSPAIAQRLAHAAFDLYRGDANVKKLKGGLFEGEVRNLRRELLLGTIPGHAFEAELDTERGHLAVRYLLTADGIEAFAASLPKQALN